MLTAWIPKCAKVSPAINLGYNSGTLGGPSREEPALQSSRAVAPCWASESRRAPTSMAPGRCPPPWCIQELPESTGTGRDYNRPAAFGSLDRGPTGGPPGPLPRQNRLWGAMDQFQSHGGGQGNGNQRRAQPRPARLRRECSVEAGAAATICSADDDNERQLVHMLSLYRFVVSNCCAVCTRFHCIVFKLTTFSWHRFVVSRTLGAEYIFPLSSQTARLTKNRPARAVTPCRHGHSFLSGARL